MINENVTDAELRRIRNRFALYKKSRFFYGANLDDTETLLDYVRDLRKEVTYWKSEANNATGVISRTREHFLTRHNLVIPECPFLSPSFEHPDDLDWTDPVFEDLR